MCESPIRWKHGPGIQSWLFDYLPYLFRRCAYQNARALYDYNRMLLPHIGLSPKELLQSDE